MPGAGSALRPSRGLAPVETIAYLVQIRANVLEERHCMGQGMSDINVEAEKVRRAVEALDEIVWDDSLKIDTHVLQAKFTDSDVYSLDQIKKVENIIKDKHAEQARMQKFYKSKSSGDPGIAGLEASSSRRVDRYDLVLRYIFVHKLATNSNI